MSNKDTVIIEHLQNNTYQVIKRDYDSWRGSYDEYVLFQGSLLDCYTYKRERGGLGDE